MRIHGLTLAALLMASSISSADVLLGDFENSMTSTYGTWSNSSNVSVSYSATGASVGSASLAVVKSAAGFDWSLALNGNVPLRDAILANDKLAFDVTMVTGPQSPMFEYSVFLASMNSDVTGWQQAAGNLQSSGGANAWNTDKVTFVWDYPQNIVNAASPWAQINIATNTGNISGPQPAIYIDNVRLIAVPEPTVLGVVAGVSTVLVRRRR